MTTVITKQLREAVAASQGEPVPLVDDETSRMYYLTSAEQFAALQALLDNSEFSPRDLYPLISKTAAEAGWNDPLMDAYDSYDEQSQ